MYRHMEQLLNIWFKFPDLGLEHCSLGLQGNKSWSMLSGVASDATIGVIYQPYSLLDTELGVH